MRILKLFKKHVLALFAAIVLIVISCNADLALPTYMSDIVDVGVQQGGIASPVPDTIRAESLDDLELFMSSKDAKAVEAVFSKADKNGIRTYKGTEDERADGSKLASFCKNNYELKHDSSYDNTYGLSFAEDAVSQCTSSSADFTVYYSYSIPPLSMIRTRNATMHL